MANRPHEMAYYEAQYARIQNDPLLQGAVVFDEHGNDMPEWYQKIGVAVSVSDFESFHFTLADGAASAAIPVSLAWPGAELIYPNSWLSTSVDEMAKRVLDTTKDEDMFSTTANEAQDFASHQYNRRNTLDALLQIAMGNQNS